MVVKCEHEKCRGPACMWRLWQVAGLGAHADSPLRLLELVQDVLHLWPGLISLVDDHHLVRLRIA